MVISCSGWIVVKFCSCLLMTVSPNPWRGCGLRQKPLLLVSYMNTGPECALAEWLYLGWVEFGSTLHYMILGFTKIHPWFKSLLMLMRNCSQSVYKCWNEALKMIYMIKVTIAFVSDSEALPSGESGMFRTLFWPLQNIHNVETCSLVIPFFFFSGFQRESFDYVTQEERYRNWKTVQI